MRTHQRVQHRMREIGLAWTRAALAAVVAATLLVGCTTGASTSEAVQKRTPGSLISRRDQRDIIHVCAREGFGSGEVFKADGASEGGSACRLTRSWPTAVRSLAAWSSRHADDDQTTIAVTGYTNARAAARELHRADQTLG